MLIQILLNEFNAYFERDSQHNTILWFDPDREWEGLLPHLASQLPLLTYDGSLLHLRYQLVDREPGESAVVYLPFERLMATQRGEAEYLRPFLYTAKVFDLSIERVLHEAGIALPEGHGKMREIRPHLPGLAVDSIGKGRAFWEGLTSLETILNRRLPDFEDLLLRLLTYPERTQHEMEVSGKAEAFWSLVTSHFGVKPPEDGRLEAWTERLTAILCLVDTYLATGKPEDFPFKETLPAPVHWDTCRTFLNKWQRDEMFNDAFAQRARAIDDQYRLADWVKTLPDPPETAALLNVAQAVWERTRERLEALRDKAEVLAFCRAQRETLRRRARGFWAREGSVGGWIALDHMADVVIGADEAKRTRTDLGTLDELIAHYLRDGWQIDRAYRDFQAALDPGLSATDSALTWTQRIYRDYLDDLTTHAGNLIVEEGTWPPTGMPLGGEAVWQSAASTARGRKAVILVDALRYEMAQTLIQRLQPGPQATLDAAVSPLPSVTQIGMAALLPQWSDFEVTYGPDRWEIRAPGYDGNLAEKTHRLAWLQQSLGAAEVFDLDTWLHTPPADVDEDATWIVIASTEIDAVGESAGRVAWHTADALLCRLEQAVRRLLMAECREIHVLSDHGFLLREDVRESEKVAVDLPADTLLKRGERYLLLRTDDAPPTDLPRKPVTGSETLEAWFPRGLGCFSTPGAYDFMHGGISLQEVIIPHVLVRQSVEERPVTVTLDLVTGHEIRNAIFKVRLVPEGVDLLSRARRVEVDIAREGERVAGPWDAVVHQSPVEKSLRLASDIGLEINDAIAVRAWDADTGELLAQQSAVVRVDLDW